MTTSRRLILSGSAIAWLGLSAFAIEPMRPAPSYDRWALDAQSRSGPTAPEWIERGVSAAVLDYEVVIPDVPAYNWYRGCGPTAAGMLLGYWDGQGFDDLVAGSAETQTSAVNDMMASSGNYDDYCLPIDYSPNMLPDKSEPPFGDEHPDNCIADFMDTSQSYRNNYWGWSWFSDVDNAISGYVDFATPHYDATVQNLTWGSFPWSALCAEIDAGRPSVFLVDTDGNGGTDHFITAIGYGEQGSTRMYACLNTWDQSIHWYEFAQISYGQPWGIYGVTTCRLESAELTQVHLLYPDDQATLSSPPAFAWIPNGGGDNVFAVDASLTPTFSAYWSSYEDLSELIHDASWTPPLSVWNRLPDRRIYWRVRGADLDVSPIDIITSDEVWSFFKE